MVGVVQLVRAPDCGSGGRGFESHYPPFRRLTEFYAEEWRRASPWVVAKR